MKKETNKQVMNTRSAALCVSLKPTLLLGRASLRLTAAAVPSRHTQHISIQQYAWLLLGTTQPLAVVATLPSFIRAAAGATICNFSSLRTLATQFIATAAAAAAVHMPTHMRLAYNTCTIALPSTHLGHPVHR
jgi:hypothetical protein